MNRAALIHHCPLAHGMARGVTGEEILKTFWPGWSDRQLADGTVVVTTPTGPHVHDEAGQQSLLSNVGHHHTRTTSHARPAQ